MAAEPGVEFATLYTKSLEISKDKALKENKGNFDAQLCLINENIIDLTWWINNVKTALKSLTRQEPTMILKTDSSQHGSGGVVKNTVLNTKGYWSYEEQKYHINYLELKAAFVCVNHFCSTKSDIHVKVFMDNMVAVNYINKMGGRMQTLNELFRQLWFWCKNRHMWLTACHLQGVENIEADRLSRSLNIDKEWKLNDDIFHLIDTFHGTHEVDLFASSCNYQIPRYFSYLPDSRAEAIDALTASWKNLNVYCFPPFSLLGRVMQKVKLEKVDMILIAPVWRTQHWFPEIFEQHSRGLVFDTEANDSLVSTPKSVSHTSVSENEFSCFGYREIIARLWTIRRHY